MKSVFVCWSYVPGADLSGEIGPVFDTWEKADNFCRQQNLRKDRNLHWSFDVYNVQ